MSSENKPEAPANLWEPINFNAMPKAAALHLLKRFRERELTDADSELFYAWIQTHPTAPPREWYKDFGTFKVVGNGSVPTSVLTAKMKARGVKLASEDFLDSEIKEASHLPVLAGMTTAMASLADVEQIAREYMQQYVKADLPFPSFVLQNNVGSKWLGRCELKGDNTLIRLQKSILSDDRTMRRVIAHELCHHEDFLLNYRALSRFEKKHWDGHGATWRAIADRFNVIEPNFVTKTSDSSDVITDTGSLYYILVYQNPAWGGKMMYAVAVRPSNKQINFIAKKIPPDTWRLFRISDPRLAVRAAKIGEGWTTLQDDETTQKITTLWETGQQVVVPEAKPEQTDEEIASSKGIFVLLLPFTNSPTFSMAVLVNPTPKDKDRARFWVENSHGNSGRLFKVTDPYWLTAPRVGKGWGSPHTAPGETLAQQKERIQRLWDTGTPVAVVTNDKGKKVLDLKDAPVSKAASASADALQFVEEDITAEESSYEGTQHAGVRIEAHQDNRTVGAIEIFIADGNAYVRGITVLQSLRGQGIGQQLYDKAISAAKKKGCANFYSDQANAMSEDAHKAWERVRNRYKVEFEPGEGGYDYTGRKKINLQAAAAPVKVKYGIVMAELPITSQAFTAVEVARDQVDDADLFGKGKNVGPIHITVRYGIQSDDTSEIEKYLSSLAPIEAKLGPTAMFPPSPQSEHAAVVIAPVGCPELHAIHDQLANVGDFKPADFTYIPHVTVAYVKPETVDKYVGLQTTADQAFLIKEVTLLNKSKVEKTISLLGMPKTAKLPEITSDSIRAKLNEIYPVLAGQEFPDATAATLINNVLPKNLRVVVDRPAPKGSFSDGAGVYVVGGHYATISGQTKIYLAEGVGKVFANASKTEPSAQWTRFADRFATIAVHEMTHGAQYSAMQERKQRDGQLDSYEKEINRPYGFDPIDPQNAMAYLSDPQEVGAFARMSVEELRNAGWTDQSILYGLRSEYLMKYEMVRASKAFMRYWKVRSQGKRGEATFRKFVENMTRIVPPEKGAPISKEEMEFYRDVSKAAATMAPPSPVTETPQFKSWFQGSKVVGKDGKPLPVYHGTTHDFDTFKADGGNAEGHYGSGIYFTNSKGDADGNYAGEGPDLKQRLDTLTENLMSELHNEKIDSGEIDEEPRYGTEEYDAIDAEARAQAEQQLKGPHQGVVMPCYLRMNNPVVISPKGGTYFEISFDEETEEESGSGLELYEAFIWHLNDSSEDPQELWGKVMESMGGDPEFSAYQFEQAMRTSDAAVDLESGPGQWIAGVYREMGFDGIIMDANVAFPGMKLEPNTKHFIVWQPNQVKSAIGNSGEFDDTKPSITAGKRAYLLQKPIVELSASQ